MGFGGDAPWALGVMWFLTALVFSFLMLRLYTRIVCLASYGIDDHIYAVAFIFLLIFTIFIHLSANYGFGQTMEQIGNLDHATKATLYECIGQSFAIIGMSIAKASLGAFLLRLVVVPWHRIAIWAAMMLVFLASVAQLLCFWLSCVPLKFVYDRNIPGGSCPIDTRPTSYILCVSTIFCDFFYALFPWIIIKDLQMPSREKYTIACSFSLGLIAAGAGIKRTTEVEGLYTLDYLHDSVGLIVWSSAEMAVTLICIGIPVCRPLYRRVYYHFRPDKLNSNYRRRQYQKDSSFALQTIGGGIVSHEGRVPPNGKLGSKSREKNSTSDSRDVEDNTSSDIDLDTEDFAGVRLGVHGPFTQTRVGRGGRRNSGADNTSVEEILGDEFRRTNVQYDDGHQHQGGGIVVTETFRVDRS